MVTDARAAAPARDPFDVLGDPQRREILRLVAERPRSVGDLARDVPVSRPAVSRHLRLLREAGLVAAEAAGTRRVYRVDPAGLEGVHAYLGQVWGEAEARFRLLAENTAPGRSAR
ncbi:MAG: metalloregulator ArsR/SmtB family transcription factor [Solirubrobacteraceae bacterium]